MTATRASRQNSIPPVRCIALALLLLPGINVAAAADIFRCTQQDGTVAFQATPCPDTASNDDAGSESELPESPVADDASDFVNPFDVAEESGAPSEPGPLAAVSQDRAECEKTTRNAIDAIDLELRRGYTKEEGQRYLAELLELTQQLRACKQL